MPTDPRLLVLLNPGQTSRYYMLGLARAAERLGVLAGTIELGPVWEQLGGAGAGAPGVRAALARQATELCARAGVTHVLSYIHNGVFDFGLVADPLGGWAHGVSPFVAAGARHILLWTDHPNWAMNASALEPGAARALAHPMHTHLVKSHAAASELETVLRWPGARAMSVGEDLDAIVPSSDQSPVYDAVVIVSDAGAVPAPLAPLLNESDPDPVSAASALRESALERWRTAVRDVPFTSANQDRPSDAALEALGAAWADRKIDALDAPLVRLADALAPVHRAALEWLRADARRWYAATAALRTLAAWRRNFWLAWLGRRMDLGVYGSPAERLGLAGSPASAQRVPYEQQAAVYARGRSAININAGHDEEGLSHKPFQIAASGVACVHHRVNGLGACFDPGDEVLVFSRGPELLDAVRSLAGDPARRARLGRAMRARARAQHRWEHRLASVLGLSCARAPAGGAALVESAA